jgi:tetratricopeptide (TPR) repeat protein
MTSRDRLEDAKKIDVDGLELCRRRGDRYWEGLFLGHLGSRLLLLGEWEEALRLAVEAKELAPRRAIIDLVTILPWLHVLRGELPEARRQLESQAGSEDSEDLQARLIGALTQAIVLRAEGRPDDALAAAQEALSVRGAMGARHPFWKLALIEAVEAAFDLDDLDKVTELLGEWERMRPVERTPFLEAHRERFEARLAARRGEAGEVEVRLDEAAELFRELHMPFYLAVTLLERAELTGSQETLAEAREIFERLKARPWLERLSAVTPSAAAAPVP